MEIEEVKGCIVATLHSFIPPPLEAAAPAPPPSPPPALDLPQLLSFVLSRLGAEGAESSSTRILKEGVKEAVEKAFSNLHFDLTQEGLSDTVRFTSLEESSCWSPYGRLGSSPDSTHFLFVLQRFSQTLSVLVSAPLLAAANPQPILATIREVWKAHEQDFIQLVMGFRLDSDPKWSHILAMLGGCLVVSEVNGMLKESSTGQQGKTASLDDSGSGEIAKLLSSINQNFPSYLYKKYKELEEQEVGGAGTLVSPLRGGQLLKVGHFELVFITV